MAARDESWEAVTGGYSMLLDEDEKEQSEWPSASDREGGGWQEKRSK